jgi:hypothetical protein
VNIQHWSGGGEKKIPILGKWLLLMVWTPFHHEDFCSELGEVKTSLILMQCWAELPNSFPVTCSEALANFGTHQCIDTLSGPLTAPLGDCTSWLSGMVGRWSVEKSLL